MNEKTGRTLYDFISEHLVITILFFAGIIALFCFGIIQIKLPDWLEVGTPPRSSQNLTDPLEIVGKWDYVVTPLDGEKLLKEDKSNNTFVESYDELKGNVQIHGISTNTNNNYSMEGLREGAFIAGEKQANTEQPLKFSEISYTKDQNVGNPYSFKFGVSIGALPSENKTQGFVRISDMKKNTEGKTILMEGMVIYLYKIKNVKESQVWREDKIVFRRNNK